MSSIVKIFLSFHYPLRSNDIMTHKNKTIPQSLKNPQKWSLQRRGFLRLMLGGAVAAQVPWWMACQAGINAEDDFRLNETQKEIMAEVQSFLFPADGNGPGASDLNAVGYLQWVLLDKGMDPNEKQYLINGMGWVEETAVEETGDSFLNLDASQKSHVLTAIAREDWGESWFSINLTFIFEALLSDPIYGSNLEGIGWKWLEHNPGQPRPSEEMKYGHFLEYIHQQQS